VSLRAVYFDFGGVIVRTEFQAPRQHLADRLKREYEDLEKAVFESESARQASVGKITEEQHFSSVMQRLHLPVSDARSFADEFFSGDVTDMELLDLARSLRKTHKVGLISNAWSGLRAWMTGRKMTDAFDEMIISAEVGLAKPDPRIYQLALEKLGVRAEESVFLDDFKENIVGARAVGMQAIHFVEPKTAIAELQALLAESPL
jgi:epoxide hydrolase-like predicted phosphatase